ncbi:hypothetical protein ABFS82_09G089400 [Erythranthe guttata]
MRAIRILARLKTMSRDQSRVLEAGGSSTSTHVTVVKASSNLFTEELKRLERRLTDLEEESEMFKEALSESVEERSKLMSEIYEYFNSTQKRDVKKRRAGLLQVLFQDTNPSIVSSKGLRTKAVVL